MPESRDYYINLARSYATQAGIDPDIFVAQINQESGFDPVAGPSSGGAMGIAQIIPRWHPGVDPWDPNASLQYAANLMAGHLGNYGGDIRKALTAYHAGPGNLQSAVDLGGADWESRMVEASGDAIGYANQAYLMNILGGGPLVPLGSVPRQAAPTRSLSTAITAGTREGVLRMQAVALSIFGQPSDQIPSEPFPGFTDLVRPYRQALDQNALQRTDIEARIGEAQANAPDILAGSPFASGVISGMADLFNRGLKAALPSFVHGGVTPEETSEEYNRLMDSLILELDTNLAEAADLDWFFAAVGAKITAYSDVDPDARTASQAMIDQYMSESTPARRQMLQPVVDAIDDYVGDAIENLTGMTPEEIAELSQQEIEEKLFTTPHARPVASYTLTTNQLRLSLQGFRSAGPGELTTGEQLRELLMAQGLESEEAQAYRQDTEAQVRAILAEARKQDQNIAAMRAGLDDILVPKPGVSDYLKAAAIRPIFLASQALDKYFRGVVHPLAGAVVTGVAVLTPGEQEIERNMELAVEDNNFWTASGEAWRANTWHPAAKFAVETLADPTTYIGWGIAPKLLKPIPIVGRRLSAMATVAEHGYLQMANAPFRAAGRVISTIPRPITTWANLERGSATGLVSRVVSKSNREIPFNRITGEQTTSALSQALETGARFPAILADDAIQTSRLLRALPVPDVDNIVAWSQRLGGRITHESFARSKTLLLDLDTHLIEAANSPEQAGIIARNLMSTLGIVDDAEQKGFNAAKALVDEYIEAGNRQAQQLIQGDSMYDIIRRIGDHSYNLTITNRQSQAALQAERMGLVTSHLNKLAEGTGAIWSGTIEKFMIRPLARSYLLFGMYHLWNVAETRGKLIAAGVNPFRKGGNPQMHLETWADVMGDRPEILLGRGRSLVSGETIETTLQASKGMDKFLAPTWLRKLLRETTAARIQANDQSLFIHKQAIAALKRNRPEQWGQIQSVLDETGMDFKFLPKDLRPWAQESAIASIIQGPDTVRRMATEVTAERLRGFRVAQMLSKYDLIDDVAQEYVISQARNGRLFTNTQDVIDEMTNQVWEKHLRSPEMFASNFENMVEEMIDAPVQSWEDLANRVRVLGGMSRGYGDVLEHQYTVAREASGKTIHAGGHDRIWGLWRKGSDEFGNRAAVAFDHYLTMARSHISMAGERASDVELLMSRYGALKDLDSAAWSQRRQIQNLIFTQEAPAGSKLRSSNEWWTTTMDRLGQPFRDAAAARKNLIREIYGLEARVGGQPRFPVPDTAGRSLSRIDMATLYGVRPDDISGMTFLTDLQAIQGRDSFIEDALSRAVFNLEPGADLARLGWTEDRIGQVWDDIMREFRLDPKNVSAVAPTMMQVDGVKHEVMSARLASELTPESRTAFEKWAAGTSDRLGQISGYAVPVEPLGKPVFPKSFEHVVHDTTERGVPVEESWAVVTSGIEVNFFKPDVGAIEFRVAIDTMAGAGAPAISNMRAVRDVIADVARSNPGYRFLAEPANPKIGSLLRRLGASEVDTPMGRLLEIPEAVVGPKARQTAPSWLEGKSSALQEATEEFYQTFPDYIDLNHLDTFMRAQFPFWTYEFHRLFYLPRQFMRTPGLATGLGRYNEATGGDNYTHIPGTSLEINPLRGTILMGGLRRLLIRDYPEFYDTFPGAQQALDVMGRFGFYPGAHVTATNILFGSKTPQFGQVGEIVPTWMKAPVQGFQAFANLTGNQTMMDASTRLANIFIPERYRDYMIAMKISDIGKVDEETGQVISGADLLYKRAAGASLSESEQDLWDKATGEMSATFILMDQTAMFRFRPEEMDQAREELDTIYSEYSGFSREQLQYMRDWGINPFDIVPPSPEVRELLNATEALQRWSGFTSVLFGASQQNFRGRRNEFWDEVDGIRQGLNIERETLDCQFGFRGATSCDFPGSITARDWTSRDSELNTSFHDQFEGLRGQDRYSDIPVTREEIVQYYSDNNIQLPVEHPIVELLRMYHDIELTEVFDPETGRLSFDYSTFYAKREMLLVAAGDRRDELEEQLLKYETELGKLHRWSYESYLRPYYNRRDLTISRYSPEAQQIINRWLAASDKPLIRAQLQEIELDGERVISRYQRDMRTSSRRFRFYSPDVDAWLAFWQVTSSFITDQGQSVYEELMRRYRPGVELSLLPVEEATVGTE